MIVDPRINLIDVRSPRKTTRTITVADGTPNSLVGSAERMAPVPGFGGPAKADDAAHAKVPGAEPEAPPASEPTGRNRAAPSIVPAGAPPGRVAKGRRRLLRPLLFALLPIALVAGGYAYVTGGQVMATDNAYVQAAILAVATDVSGIVQKIDVRENQQVAAGDVLFRLDDLPLRLALTRAEAQVGIIRNDLVALHASYRDMQEQIVQGETDIAFYKREFERQQELAKRNVASQATFDQANHNLATAQQKLASLKQQLAGIAANLNGAPDDPVEQHPRYRDAVAARDEAARQLAHAVVKAPFAGTVTNVPSLQVGQYLAAATPAFSIVATDHVWIQASPKETELTYVRPGQPASISVDTYPGQVWRGTVDSISPASGSSFSLLPAQNTTGNWVKVVQRIPMRVRIDTPAGSPPLRVGMSVTVDVDTGHPRGLPEAVARLLGRPEVRHE